MERNSAQGPQNEIWWKCLFVPPPPLQIYAIFGENGACSDWQAFAFISEGFEDFS